MSVGHGNDIGKMAYGGPIPYVRTTDLNGWEIVASPKQGVDRATYERYADIQQIEPGDVLFVRDGLYLIGATSLVTKDDLPMIHQSHLIRLRPRSDCPIQGPLLLALLSTPIARLQVRSKQFTAGIIDKIEDRYHELALPVPRHRDLGALNAECAALLERRVELRERLRRIPLWAQGLLAEPDSEYDRFGSGPGGPTGELGFTVRASNLAGTVLIPKYYDPLIEGELNALEPRFDLRSVGELEESGLIELDTGVEVGKLAYGSGSVPFIRTSDLCDWELKAEPKHRVSESVAALYAPRTDVQAEDVFVVRDGTYLVGTSAIVDRESSGVLYAGGLYKLRSLDQELVDPYLLMAMLNMPIVKRQIQAKRFTRDVIDTLGRRFLEVVLPIPRDDGLRREIAAVARSVCEERNQLRQRAREIALGLEGGAHLDEEEQELLRDEGDLPT